MEVRRISNNFPDELYHHGILGQRWGIRRYQNKDGTLTEAGKQRIKKKGFFETRRDKKKMKKLREAKEQKKREKEERERIINSGDANEIDKIKHKLTDEEYARALTRVDFNRSLNEYKSATNRAKLEDISNKVSTVAKVVGTVANTADAGIKVYEGLQRAGLIEKKTSEMDKLRNEKTRLELVSDISDLTNRITDNKSKNQKEIASLKRDTELEKANYELEKAKKDREDLKKPDPMKQLEKESREWEYKAKIAKNQRTFNNGGMSDKELNKQADGKKNKKDKKDKGDSNKTTLSSKNVADAADKVNIAIDKVKKIKVTVDKVKEVKSSFDSGNLEEALDKAKRKKLEGTQDVNIAKTFVDAGLVPEVKKGLKGNKRAAVQAGLVRQVYEKEHNGKWTVNSSDFKDWLRQKGYDEKDIQYLTGGNPIKHSGVMKVRRLRDDELYHHGIKGQRWGIRRFQNEDGSLTAAGRERYEKLSSSEIGKLEKRKAKLSARYDKAKEKGNTKKMESFKNAKELTEKEIEVVKNYKLSDFNRERTDLGNRVAKSVIATSLSTVTLAAAVGTGIGLAGGLSGATTAAVTAQATKAGNVISRAGRIATVNSAFNAVGPSSKTQYRLSQKGMSDKAYRYYNKSQRAKTGEKADKYMNKMDIQIAKDAVKYGDWTKEDYEKFIKKYQ